MKKNLLKIALILVLVLTACIVFAACDPDNSEEKENVELVLWGPAQQQKMAEEMIEAFKRSIRTRIIPLHIISCLRPMLPELSLPT